MKYQLSKSFTIPGKTLLFDVRLGVAILLLFYGLTMRIMIMTKAKTNMGMLVIDINCKGKEDIFQ